jgi:purine-nucleoside/S-methyl-5'-thioadenosine phosphorylase / adenosine deaminase
MIVSDLLKEQNGVRHGFFTREGGVSDGIYSSLNCGAGSRDKPANVRQNRLRVAAKLGAEPDMLLTVRQVHSDTAIFVERPWPSDSQPEGDAIVTNAHLLAIGILTADCTPILFADAEAGVIGAAHAGWRGAKNGIIESTVAAMERLGAARDRIFASVGPTISQLAYEVGDDFEANFLADAASNGSFFTRPSEGAKPHFDLPRYCLKRLKESGLRYCEVLGLCTYENESLFFSYRRSVHREEPDYGRQISAIVLV